MPPEIVVNTPVATPTPAAAPQPMAASVAPPSAQPATPAAAPASDKPAPKLTGLDRLKGLKPGEALRPNPDAKPKAGEAAPDKPLHVEDPSTPPGTTTKPPEAAAAKPAVDPNLIPPPGDPAIPAEWTPNWKFKVMDKEHEIPEWMRETAKGPEQEKQLRELHEKAFGLDIVKPRLAESQKRLNTVVPQLQRYEASKSELVGHYKRGDFDSFFKTLDVPPEKVLQWAVKKAQLSQLPPEQQQFFEQQSATERRAAELETQLQQANSTIAESTTQARGRDLQTELAKPEVVSLAEAFNKAAGKPNAFFDEIVAIGEAAWYRDKTDLSPAQAVQMAVAKYRNFLGTPATPAVVPGAAAEPVTPGLIPPEPAPGAVRAPNGQFATKPASGQAAPTLPNVGARSGSPVGGGKQIRSIQDLRDRAKELSSR